MGILRGAVRQFSICSNWRKYFIKLLALAAIALGGSRAMANTHLFLVGGGTTPQKAIERFVYLSRDQNGLSRILFVSWASEEPLGTYQRIANRMAALGNVETKKSPDFAQMSDSAPLFLEQVAWATAIFFNGGDQNNIMKVFDQNPSLLDPIRQKFDRGFPVGGTSAGMAVMSARMFTGEGDFKKVDPTKVETVPSLGFISNAMVDSHYLAEKRENRLFGFLLGGGAKLGLGVDQDGALEVTDDAIAENIGPELVMAVDAAEHPGKLLVEMIYPGDLYDLGKRQKLIPSSANPLPQTPPINLATGTAPKMP